MHARELYMLRARNGLYTVPVDQTLEAFGESKMRGFRNFREHWYWETSDGRWLHIGHHRAADGGSVAIWTDLTDLKAAQDQRQKLESQLLHSQKLEALGTLAGGVAHDLNNTLVPIMALTKMTAAKLPEGSQARRNLDRVIEASTRARDLVQQIVAFSRKDTVPRQKLDLAPLVQEALGLLRASIPATIRFDAAIAPTAPLFGDRGQLHQVLINLVTNAAQAIGDRTGAIAVALTVLPPVAGAADHMLLAVKDDGCGMDEATSRRIFDPFFTTKAVGEGTGLGLSVAHGIVAAHGGRIEVSSVVGQGSEFRVYLPVVSN
jgi:signal transduction histidine kinase